MCPRVTHVQYWSLAFGQLAASSLSMVEHPGEHFEGVIEYVGMDEVLVTTVE